MALLRNQLGETSESLELLKCAEFVGPPGSGSPLAQPFSVSAAQEVPCPPAAETSPSHGMHLRPLTLRGCLFTQHLFYAEK